MIDVILVLSYLLFMVAWGIFQAKKVEAGGEFSGAGLKQSMFMVFAAMTASFIGGGFSFGLASRAFAGGIGHVLTLWGFSAGTVLVGIFVAPRLQKFKGCASVGSLIGITYGPAARAAVGMLAALFCCAVLGAQLRALGLLFNAWLGLDFRLGALIGAAALVALCAAGGSRAIVSIAPVQCLLLLTGFSLMLMMSMARAGGAGNFVSSIPSDRLNVFSALSPAEMMGLFLMFMTGETLAPPYVKNLLTGKDGASARKGAVAAGLFSILLFAMCGAIGLCALVFLPKMNPELALPALLNSILPPGLRGLAAAGIVAGLTAAGSAFLSAAISNLTADVLPPFLPRESPGSLLPALRGHLPQRGRQEGMEAGAKPRHQTLPSPKMGYANRQRRTEARCEKEGLGRGLVVARVSTILFGIVAAAVAIFTTGVLEALGLAYRLWAPAVAAPLVAAAFGRRSGPTVFWVSATAGIIGMLLWELAYGNPFHIPSVVSGIMVSAGVLFLFPKTRASTA